MKARRRTADEILEGSMITALHDYRLENIMLDQALEQMKMAVQNYIRRKRLGRKK